MAIQDSTLTQEYLQSIFEYKDGKLFRKKEITALNLSGYLITQIKRKNYSVHRLIFMMHYGYLPEVVDHIDGNRLNNSIENLRAATMQQNAQNSKLRKNNKSGIKGVSWHKKTNKWRVQISVNKKVVHFGEYFDLEVAKFVAETMRYKYHKNFANNG
jgi:hypothetical protein